MVTPWCGPRRSMPGWRYLSTTPAKPGQFARSPWVHVGNHTRDHVILNHCTPAEMAGRIAACQDALATLVGFRPMDIAYPNGNFSPLAVQTATAAGLRLGFTVAPRRPRLPLDSDTRMTLGRFFFHGAQGIRRQCRLFAARFVPSYALKAMTHGSLNEPVPAMPPGEARRGLSMGNSAALGAASLWLKIGGSAISNPESSMPKKIRVEADICAPKPVPPKGYTITTGNGQKISLERGSHTRSKKNPGKRPHQG